MNYQKIYSSIVENRLTNLLPKTQYTERHHIIPRSIGGSDSEENIVRLSAKEHFICHYLLIKIHSSGPAHYKMIKAFGLMSWMYNDSQNRYKCNSRTYEFLKKKYSEAQSFNQTGKRNSQSGSFWITNNAESKKIKSKDLIPKGWYHGRIIRLSTITNGIKNIKIPSNTECPLGWRLGSFKVREHYILVTNESINIVIKSNVAIPDGYRRYISKAKKPKKTTDIASKISLKHYKIRRSKSFRNAKANKLYIDFIKSNTSLRKFAICHNINVMTLSKLFKEFIVDYNWEDKDDSFISRTVNPACKRE